MRDRSDIERQARLDRIFLAEYTLRQGINSINETPRQYACPPPPSPKRSRFGMSSRQSLLSVPTHTSLARRFSIPEPVHAVAQRPLGDLQFHILSYEQAQFNLPASPEEEQLSTFNSEESV